MACKSGVVLTYLLVAVAAAVGSLCCSWEQEAHLKGDRKCAGASLPVC